MADRRILVSDDGKAFVVVDQIAGGEVDEYSVQLYLKAGGKIAFEESLTYSEGKQKMERILRAIQMV